MEKKKNEKERDHGAAGMEREADRIQEDIRRNEPNYHDDPQADILVDERPEAPNGMFGDHEDDFDI